MISSDTVAPWARRVDDDPHNSAEQFRTAAAGKRTGLLREIWDFLKIRKKWWLTPIIIALLLVSAILIIGAASGPWIYTLF